MALGYGLGNAQTAIRVTPVIDYSPIYYLFTTQTDGPPQVLTEGATTAAAPVSPRRLVMGRARGVTFT